jgi:hypothetical protein
MKASADNSFDVKIDHLHKLKAQNTPFGIYLSLVNISRENNIGQLEPFKKTGANIEIKSPPVYINISVMVTAHFTNYNTALIHLGSALEFFQNKPYLNKYNILPVHNWPLKLENIVFDWYNLEIDKLNQLWGINGGLYHPSFLYKVRMLKVLHKEVAKNGPAIDEIKYQSIIT